IGSLIYLTIFIRLDLVFSINYLARYIFNPILKFSKYFNNRFSYLLNTKNYRLNLSLKF
ncbi:hypothetical protein COCHEDRAFT_1106996, partial [Bipolaris maydis C5]